MTEQYLEPRICDTNLVFITNKELFIDPLASLGAGGNPPPPPKKKS